MCNHELSDNRGINEIGVFYLTKGNITYSERILALVFRGRIHNNYQINYEKRAVN